MAWLEDDDSVQVSCELAVRDISVPFKQDVPLRAIEYDFGWLSGEDGSVHQNNASMIEMLIL
ncbi:hypothetical protein SLEP1_g39236 [Rubroshorea leprosula]|uniref:Uncharacterized protein n=1 Tax=Rubroshorea leprosula TaxID=152421 RepID=A0AAV5L026_9ROSI|nr:hypothetical protein SLEP1_g39236 [Rubroshorea leprosula]